MNYFAVLFTLKNAIGKNALPKEWDNSSKCCHYRQRTLSIAKNILLE